MQTKTKEQNRQIGALIKDFAEHTVHFYDNLQAQPVCRPIDNNTLKYLEEISIPKQGRPIQDVYTEMLRVVYSNTLLAQHPAVFLVFPLRHLCFHGWEM